MEMVSFPPLPILKSLKFPTTQPLTYIIYLFSSKNYKAKRYILVERMPQGSTKAD